MAYGTSYVPLTPPSQARRAPIGYGQQYGLPYNGADDPVATGNLSLAERNALLQQVSDQSPSTVSWLMDALDTGGKAVRSTLSGIDDATPENLLESYGLLPSEDFLGGYGRPLFGFGAAVATDPLTYTGFGALGGGLSKAGRAAKAAGLLDDSARAASRSMLDDIARGTSSVDDLGRIGKKTAKFFSDDFGKDISRLTDEDLYARPLYGWRESRRSQTLGDLLERQKDWGNDAYQKAIDDLDNWLYRNGGSINDLKGTRLASDISFGFGNAQLGINLPGGGALSRGLDTLGSAVRWSAPGRYAAAAFDRNVHGATDAASQVGAKVLSRSDNIADAAARKEAHRLTALLPKFKTEQMDIRMGRAMRNVIEGTGAVLSGDNLADYNKVLKDLTDYRAGTAIGESAQIGQFVDEWQKLSAKYLDRSRKAGIGSSALNDKFGTGYFPRILEDEIFNKSGSGVSKGRTFSVMTGDQLARGKAFHIPGGTSTLEELSLDRNIAGAGRLMASDDDAANYILQKMREKEQLLDAAGKLPVDQARVGRLIAKRNALLQKYKDPATGAWRKGVSNATKKRVDDELQFLGTLTTGPGKPKVKYTRSQATTLAKKLRQIDENALNKGLPIFSQHPAENIARYIQGRERAISRAGTLENMLASVAVPGRANSLTGGGWTSMPTALKQLNLRSVETAGGIEGARAQIAQRLGEIGKKFNIPEFKNISPEDLSEVSVDSRVLHRLHRIADFYQVPEVQSQFFKTMDALTSLWKSSILSWPSRFTRDWVSGSFSNLVEVGNPRDLLQGSSASKYLIQGQWDRLDPILEQMPRYRSLSTQQARIEAYLKDIAESGISRGRQLADVGTEVYSRRGSKGIRSQLMAANDPETTLGYQAGDLLMGRHLIGDAVSPTRMASAELFNMGNWKKSVWDKGLYGWDTVKDALKGIKDTDTVNPILRWSARLGDTTDKINRISGLNGLLLQGVSLEEAAKRITSAHVDYNSLTKFEKGWLRSTIPFWSYNSRIGKWVAEQIATRPGGPFTQVGMRLPQMLSEDDTKSDYVPTRIASKYGVSLEPMRGLPGLGPLVDAIAPKTEGVSSWLSDIDLAGIDQMNMAEVVRNADGQVKIGSSLFGTAGNIAGQAHPLLKAGFEAMTGTDSYTGIEKNWSRNTLPVMASRLGLIDPTTDYQTAEKLGYLDVALQFGLPFYGRGSQMMRRFSDPRIPTQEARSLQTAFNMFTGNKIENIDDQEKSRDALDKIQRLIGDDPAIRSFESVYIPQELLPAVDPQTQAFYQLDRQLRKERRAGRNLRPDVYNPMNY